MIVLCANVLVLHCSDLRPANVLLTDRGHIRLTYISQWSAVIPRLSAEARDNLYMAPGKRRVVLKIGSSRLIN